MGTASTKALKLILFIGLFAYLQYYDIHRGDFTINSILAGIVLSSAVYLLISLFGFILSVSRNYLITIILTLILAFSFLFKLDEVIANTPLTNEIAAALMGVCALFFILRDLSFIKRSLSPPSPASNIPNPEANHSNYPQNETFSQPQSAQQVVKENPEWMMQLSKELEARMGHKPTYEELVDYVDNKMFHILTDEDVEEEIRTITENARKSYRSSH